MSEHLYGMRAWGVILVLVVGFSVWLSLSVRDLGFRIVSQPEIEVDYVMGVFWWCIFAIAIAAFGGHDRKMLLFAWIGKFFVVLVAMLVYEWHYGLDATSYHESSKTGYYDYLYPGFDFREDLVPSINPIQDEYGRPLGGIGTENFVRSVLVISSLTGPFYHAIKVAFAFLGLVGIWCFYRAVVAAIGRPLPPAFYLLAFFPSILFWSSIFGKDPLQFFFLGLYAYGGALWLAQGGLSGFWLIGIGLFGSYLIRPWISGMAAASLLLAFLLSKCRPWQIALMGLSLIATVLLADDLESIGVPVRLNLETFLEHMSYLQEGLLTSGGGSSGGELIDLSSGQSFAANLPLVIFTGLFRPLPFDVRNPFIALAAIENTVVLVLALVGLYHFRLVYLRDPLVLWPALYALIWAVFNGFLVMGNLGAGARYKLQVWPFLALVVVCLAHSKGRALIEARVSGKDEGQEGSPRVFPST